MLRFSTSDFSSFYGGEVNLVGALGGQKFLLVFKTVGKKHNEFYEIELF